MPRRGVQSARGLTREVDSLVVGSVVDFDCTASTWSLRAALMSVVAHVHPDPDVTTRHRVRVYLTEAGLSLAATDGFTAAMASVELEDQAAETGCFDLSPGDVKKLLALFKPPKDQQASLRLQWSEKELTATDVSGMFPGESLRLIPPTVDLKFPNVAQTITAAWNMRDGGLPSPYLSVSGERLARFHAASKALAYPLVLQPTARGRAIVISCGPDFLGALMPDRQDDEIESGWTDERRDWCDRVGPMSAVHPSPPSEIRITDSSASSVEYRRPGSDAWETVDLSALLQGDEDGDGHDSSDGGES